MQLQASFRVQIGQRASLEAPDLGWSDFLVWLIYVLALT